MTATSDSPAQPSTAAGSSAHSIHEAPGRSDEEQAIQHKDNLNVPSTSPGPSSEREETESHTRRRTFLSQVPDFIKQTLDGVTGASSSPTAHGATEVHLDALVKAYKESSIAKAVHEEVASAVASNTNTANGGDVNQTRDVAEESNVLRGRRRASWTTQFRILSGRAFKNLYRDPALLTAHYAAAIVIAGERNKLGVFCDLMGFQSFAGYSFIMSVMIYRDSKTASGFSSSLWHSSGLRLFRVLVSSQTSEFSSCEKGRISNGFYDILGLILAKERMVIILQELTSHPRFDIYLIGKYPADVLCALGSLRRCASTSCPSACIR